MSTTGLEHSVAQTKGLRDQTAVRHRRRMAREIVFLKRDDAPAAQQANDLCQDVAGLRQSGVKSLAA